jgi:hypothetical protein
VDLLKDSPSAGAEIAALPVVTTVVEELWENQRRKPLKSFSSESLFASDPPPFSDSAGCLRWKESVTCPEAVGGISWAWVSDWALEATQGSNPEGWAYATHWNKTWHAKKGKKTAVRRRKWFRVRKGTSRQLVAAVGVEEGVPPGVSL